MRILVIFLTLIVLSLGSLIPQAKASVDIGVSIGDEGLRGFYLAVGDYYRVPQREVVIIRERGMPYEELPVVYFIAGRARVAPEIIVNLRLGGMSWMDITLRYGLSPEIFYVPVRVGPPYGKAYGYYMNKPKKEWKKIVFKDSDIINLVNLKFTSEHYKYSPNEVIKMREKGKNFVVINDEIKKGKKEHKVKDKRQEKEKHKGKGKDKDKD
ncbi:MAG: hypothetical protein L6246_06070 [Thermodesulfovibrionales bacterium]|nr:hypothetical protein [Nitrospinota bacterium]MCG2709863.1 hypothetical protein [Thermodesulfovibrionales bacterium]